MTLNKGTIAVLSYALVFCCAEAFAQRNTNYDRYADGYVDAPAPAFFEAPPPPQVLPQEVAPPTAPPQIDYISEYVTYQPATAPVPAPVAAAEAAYEDYYSSYKTIETYDTPPPVPVVAPVIRKPAAVTRNPSLKQLLALEQDDAAALLTRFHGKNINAHILSENNALRRKGRVVIPNNDIILTAIKVGTPVYTMKCEAAPLVGNTIAAVKPHAIDCGAWYVNLEEKTVNPSDAVASKIAGGKQ